jgi:hypothetical protein
MAFQQLHQPQSSRPLECVDHTSTGAILFFRVSFSYAFPHSSELVTSPSYTAFQAIEDSRSSEMPIESAAETRLPLYLRHD